MRSILLISIAILLSTTTANASNLINESVRQQGSRVVISYDLTGNNKPVPVTLDITIGGKTSVCAHEEKAVVLGDREGPA